MGIRPEKAPTAIRTADVLALVNPEPTRVRDIAQALNVLSWQLSGHLAYLVSCGKVARTARGMVQRTPFGTSSLEAA